MIQDMKEYVRETITNSEKVILAETGWNGIKNSNRRKMVVMSQVFSGSNFFVPVDLHGLGVHKWSWS